MLGMGFVHITLLLCLPVGAWLIASGIVNRKPMRLVRLVGGVFCLAISVPALWFSTWVSPLDYFLPNRVTCVHTTIPGHEIAFVQSLTDDFYWSRMIVRNEAGEWAFITLDPDDIKWWFPKLVEKDSDVFLEHGLFHRRDEFPINTASIQTPITGRVYIPALDYSKETPTEWPGTCLNHW